MLKYPRLRFSHEQYEIYESFKKYLELVILMISSNLGGGPTPSGVDQHSSDFFIIYYDTRGRSETILSEIGAPLV